MSLLRRDVVVYGAAVAVERTTGLILLPILTSYFYREAYGVWSQVLVAHSLMSSILLLGFYDSIARFVPSRPRSEVGRTLHGMVALVIAFSLVFGLAVLAAPRAFSTFFFATPDRHGIMLEAAAFIGTECLFELLVSSFLRADGRMRACSAYHVAKSLARLGVLWTCAARGTGLSGMLLGLTGVNVILMGTAYVFQIMPTVDVAVRGLGREHWRGVLRYCLPVMAAAMLGWTAASLNRFFIVHLLGLSELGIYSANYSIASIVSIVSLVIPFVIVPHTNAAWNRGEPEEVRKILETGVSYYLFAAVPLAVAVALFYEPLLRLLAPRDFQGSVLLVWALSGYMVLYGLEQITTFATLLKESTWSVLSRGVAVALNAAACIFLLRRYGIGAAAAGAVVAAAATIALNLYRLSGMAGVRFPWKAVGRLAIPVAGMAGAALGLRSLLGTGAAPSLGAAVAAAICFAALEFASKHSILRSLLAAFPRSGGTGAP